MMKKYLTVLLYIHCAAVLYGQSGKTLQQKPVIDRSAYSSWPEISQERISNDGKYVLYVITSEKSGPVLNIQATNGGSKKEIPGVGYGAAFTEDSRYAIFLRPGDSLCLYELNNKNETYINDVSSFKIPDGGTGDWMAYQLKNNDLVVYNLRSKKSMTYNNVLDYSFSKSGNNLTLQTLSGEKENQFVGLQWLNLLNEKLVTVWKGKRLSQYSFDATEKKLCLLSQDYKDNQPLNRVWYYSEGMDSAQILIDERSAGMNGLIAANRELQFSQNGKKLFFQVTRKRPVVQKKPEAVAVDIWNYQSLQLQSAALYDLQSFNSFKKTDPLGAVINFDDKKVVLLEDEVSWGGMQIANHGDADYILYRTLGNIDDGYFRPDANPNVFIVSTKDGSKKCIQKQLLEANPFYSPSGNFIIWYDLNKKAYFSYDMRDQKVRNISSQIPVPLYDETWDLGAAPREYGAAVWLKNDEGILIYDRYDIWQVDLKASRAPINITKGYGRKNKIILRYMYIKGREFANAPAIEADQKILLCGFNEVNKNNGFFKAQPCRSIEPELLYMGPNLMYYSNIEDNTFRNFFILKAKNSDTYVVKRMSATDYPNLYTTNDFVTYSAISDIQPQKSYNWLTTELVKWKTFDGSPGVGILYKPENFDSTKKYPIIFYFYDRLSYGLNNFLNPGFSTGRLDIPSYVSNGYLVFVPDICFKLGQPGASTYNYVVSAAKMLAKRTWVDENHMGIQGHSWGGYETNYLVTHTNIFSAAAEAAGPSDVVSICGILSIGNEGDGHGFAEQAQFRMGKSLWEDPGAYIKSSPIFSAHKVSTPLLIMHNKKDENVRWSQGVEMFTSLRRLNKRVWMLQYDNFYHTVNYGKAAEDYSTRLMQYFDHYLKGAPAPKWMLYGVAAENKGVDDGLELVKEKDKNGKWLTPKTDGLLNDEQMKKIEALKHRKPVTVTID